MIIYLGLVGSLLAAMGLVGLFFASDTALRLFSGVFAFAGILLFVIAFRIRPRE
jgi:hypothetical protein